MDTKKTKTERFLDLITELATCHSGKIDDYKLRELLGSPSKAQYHRYVNELTKDGKRPLLVRHKEKEEITYELNIQQPTIQKKKPLLRVIGEEKFVFIKVYGQSRNIFQNFLSHYDLVEVSNDYTVIKCKYYNSHDFLRTLFPIAEEAEIMDNDSLKHLFVMKAKKATQLNLNSHQENVVPLKKVA